MPRHLGRSDRKPALPRLSDSMRPRRRLAILIAASRLFVGIIVDLRRVGRNVSLMTSAGAFLLIAAYLLRSGGIDSTDHAAGPPNPLPAPVAEDHAGQPREVATRAGLSGPGSAPSPSGAEPVNALDLPRTQALAEVFDSLAIAADAGDVDAACRLAWDLDLCDRQDEYAEAQEFWIDAASRHQPESDEERRAAAHAASLGAQLRRSKYVCRGLAPDQLAQAGGRMYRAGVAGHPLSMTRFALDPGFGETIELQEIDLALLFRQNAVPLLEMAADSGDVRALVVLASAYHEGEMETPYGSLGVGRDPAAALGVALAAQDHVDPRTAAGLQTRIAELSAQLTPREVAWAHDTAKRYKARIQPGTRVQLSSGFFAEAMGETCVNQQE